jgi:acyl-CoA thioesterase-2
MGVLQDDTAVREIDGRLTASLSQDWEIWGPNGGYLASIALRAAGRVAPSGHRPVSFSCQYLSSPAFEAVTLEVEAVKAGRSAYCLNVAMMQGGVRQLQAQVWTTNRTQGPSVAEHAPPPIPAPAELHPMEHYLPKDAPRHRFWRNIEVKPERFPGEGERNPEGSITRQWFRYVGYENPAADPYLDAARSLLMIDTLFWPAHWRGQPEAPTYIAPSLDLSAWFRETAPAEGWLLIESRADVAGGGLIHGRARVWDQAGRLIAGGGSQLLVVNRTAP